MLARISWTRLRWLLSLAVISELYCLAREFFHVFKILIILCHPKVKDVIYFMNCSNENNWPPWFWENEHALPLRGIRWDYRTGPVWIPWFPDQEWGGTAFGEEYQRISIYLQTPVNCWLSRLSPELIMNTQPAAGQMNLLCAFILSCSKNSTWSFTWYHKQRSDLQSWSVLGEKCSVCWVGYGGIRIW